MVPTYVVTLLAMSTAILALAVVVPRLWNWYFAITQREGTISEIFEADSCIIVHFKDGAIVVPTAQEPIFAHYHKNGEAVRYRVYLHRRHADLPRGGLA